MCNAIFYCFHLSMLHVLLLFLYYIMAYILLYTLLVKFNCNALLNNQSICIYIALHVLLDRFPLQDESELQTG